jgi:maltooligosyltrehalose trehalohydrolase
MIGANLKDEGVCEFIVWAPLLENISLKIVSPHERLIPMTGSDRGYWNVTVEDILPGMRYVYNLEGERERPDPASFFQPRGVHESSQVIDHKAFQWDDSDWRGLALSKMIIYELHVGTFTSDGTFDAAIARLADLKEIGINTIEIMPVAQFPGDRNWGYDGVYPFAVQNSYGGPDGLKGFVNECHCRGMAVILDVVYNHLGPEGNYLWDYGPYFTDNYKTPWGQAINFDGPYSNEIRRYFIENALYWFEYYHIDALRLDAIHGIYDTSARHFLLELAERVREYSEQKGNKYYLIAESDLNNSSVAKSVSCGGYGVDSLWCDDFHHSVHTLLTGESRGYYADFGRTEHLVKSLREGFVYSGQFSGFRNKNHGNSSEDLAADQFIVFSQNHDQVGNRMLGERLSRLVSFESQKLAAGIVLLSPYVPLLFMGEEYGETAPFLYFVSHSDPQLIEGIREGRKREFESFSWGKEPLDPQGREIFMKSKLRWEKRNAGSHMHLLSLYRELIRLRQDMPPLACLDKNCCETWSEKNIIFLRRWKNNHHALALFNFDKGDITCSSAHHEMRWEKVLDSSDRKWDGPGTLLPENIYNEQELTIRAESFALYIKES